VSAGANQNEARAALRGQPGRNDLKRRAAALALTLAVGLIIGAIGVAVTGSQMFWLAVPASLAAVWWFIGTPQDCLCVDDGAGPQGDAGALGKQTPPTNGEGTGVSSTDR
jgi:hypothetical protein